MKKVLSLVLALAMVLGCLSFVFATEFSDVAADADQHDAIAVCSDLGIVSGYTDGTFKPEKVVTRAEACALIVKALGISPSASATTTFSDVPASHWASGYIAYATSLGIVSGYTDGTFKPDQTVSYDQMVTMLVQALGYTIDALNGTYPAAFVSKAKTLGILDDVDALGTVGANRADVAQLLYNTLPCRIGHTDNDGYWAVSQGKDGYYDTMFGRLGAYLLTDADGDAKNIIITESDIDDAVIDLSSYLGKRVTVYENEDDEIVAVYEVNSTTVTGKLKPADGTIGDYKLDTSGSNVAADDAVVTFLNGEVQSDINTYAKLIAANDGAADPSYLYIKKTMTFECKVKGNYVVEIYSAQKWSASAEKQMTKALLKGLKADEPNLLGVEFEMTRKDEIDTDTFTLVGVDSLDEIKVDDIVTVYARPKTGTVSKVVVCDDVVTGKVTKLSADKTTVTVNGTSYDAADRGSSVSDFKAADFTNTFKFYLNGDGDVACFEQVTSDTSNAYGILTDVIVTGASTQAKSGEHQDIERKVKIFTAEGKTVTYTLDNTWDEDANNSKGAFEVMPEFTDVDSLGTTDALVVYTLDEDGKLVDIARADGAEADFVLDAADFKGYAVKSIDESGVLVSAATGIDNAKLASSASVFCAEVDKSVTPNTVSWSVMTVADAKDDYTFSTDKVGAYAIYDVDAKNISAVAAVFDGVIDTDDDVYGVFTGKGQVGANKYEVSFIAESAAETYTIKDSALFAELKEDGVLLRIDYAAGKPSKVTTQAGITYKISDDAELEDGTYYGIYTNVDADKKPMLVSVVLDENLVVYYYDGDDVELVAADDVEKYLLDTDYKVTVYYRRASTTDSSIHETTVSYIVVEDK